MVLSEKYEAREENVPAILAWVEEKSLEFLSMSVALKMQLVAEEAVLNVAHYAYAQQSEDETRPLLVTIGQEGGRAYIELKDWGMPFNPLENITADPTLPLEQRQIGGWGRALIVQITTQASYEHVGGANTLRLEFVLEDAASLSLDD